MRTTIDKAGRIVVPKAIRDAMGLSDGGRVDLFFTDGRIEIAVAPAEVEVEFPEGEFPRIVYKDNDIPPLTDDIIRATLDALRQ
ncbi:MAG: AbrB/MazE/SpoVT family DNA-binding domain-containing protein [Nocardioidaceae bacterium]|nr:AbrB/MazE/SpoVT family DNA-binding domain-containing protein [Nocardioidaceae bacterium]